ncbi:hypothetical protein JCM8547_003689 [Rhodosporidiobolus lusitaniae]
MTQVYAHSPVPPRPQKVAHGWPDEPSFALAQELFEAPTVTGARFVAGGALDKGVSVLSVSTSTKSLSALTKRNATQSLFLSSDSTVLAAGPTVFTSEEVKHIALSPDGKRQALFRVLPAKDGREQKRVLEIVDVLSGRKEAELDVTKEHGDWYFDGTFGPPAWHPSLQALVYTAEEPARKPDSKSSRPGREKFEYEADFGETFTGKRMSMLFLFLLPESPMSALVAKEDEKEDRATLHRLTFPETVAATWFGQPVFLPSASEDKLALVATGYSSLGDGRKLGIVYCQNRPARVYALSAEIQEEKDDDDKPKKVYRVSTATPFSPEDRSSRSPRVVPSSSSSSPEIVYLSNPLGGPHASCGQLHLATLSSISSPASPCSFRVAEERILVPVVDIPNAKSPGAGTSSDPFPGLYVDQLPLEPFLQTKKGYSVVMSSIWRSRRVPLLVDLLSGKVTNLAPWPAAKEEEDAALPYLYLSKDGKEDELGSFTVVGTDGKDRVVALRSSPISAPMLVVGRVVEEGFAEWKVVSETGLSKKASAALSKLSYTVLPLPKIAPTELILISPADVPIDPTREATLNLPPLITQPHGGPHSTVCTEYNFSAAVAAALFGYRFVHVNYPGSLGFGQSAVLSLPPRLGELEVEATLAAPHYLNQLSLASRTKGKNLLMGGSHGGWTACHLTARWPGEFDAVVMRNPVTDLVANSSMTDIPDWCFAEGDLPYSFSSPPSHLDPSTFAKMHSLSPLRHAHAVTTPTLLLIGASDRRVPPDQGRAWFHALKNRDQEKGAKEVEVEMLKFPGNGHPIAETVEAEWVAWESGVRWLARFTDFEQ